MKNILGDITFTSLLEMIEMEPEKKQEIIDLLPKMDGKDRSELFESLSQLLEYQFEKEVIIKEADMLKGQTPESIDWEKFDNIKKEAAEKIISKEDEKAA